MHQYMSRKGPKWGDEWDTSISVGLSHILRQYFAAFSAFFVHDFLAPMYVRTIRKFWTPPPCNVSTSSWGGRTTVLAVAWKFGSLLNRVFPFRVLHHVPTTEEPHKYFLFSQYQIYFLQWEIGASRAGNRAAISSAPSMYTYLTMFYLMVFSVARGTLEIVQKGRDT